MNPPSSTTSPLARAALSFQRRALKIKRAKTDAIEALIKSWYPGYLGRYSIIKFEDPRWKQSPGTRLVLWEEGEWLGADMATSMIKWSLYERASWNTWDSLSAPEQAIPMLHMLRALHRQGTVHRTTFTLTVQVDHPEHRGDRFHARYIDIETGREWIAQCWSERRARWAKEDAAKKGEVAA
jgi:hypothetical protein